MGLSRRMFTKEFKLAAVQRLERGSSIGEVARALEVNPNVLHRALRTRISQVLSPLFMICPATLVPLRAPVYSHFFRKGTNEAPAKEKGLKPIQPKPFILNGAERGT